MQILKEQKFIGERALFAARDVEIRDSVFCDGESPLKESSDVSLYGCIFKWKYPLWYSKNAVLRDTTLLETARSGIWYTENIDIENCTIDAPKTFRRSKGISLSHVSMPNALESLWSCQDVTLRDVTVKGDYFGMNSSAIDADGLRISGNYAFDGARDITVRNSRLISKDAFWNCANVTVYDSVIIGEYLGWNSKNVRLVNCYIESNQGLCYMDGLKMENCKLVNTDLAFEYAEVDADIVSDIISVKNPKGGRISSHGIGELIMEKDRVDVDKTEIVIKE